MSDQRTLRDSATTLRRDNPPTPAQRRHARLVCAGYALTRPDPAAALTELLAALGLHPTHDQEADHA